MIQSRHPNDYDTGILQRNLKATMKFLGLNPHSISNRTGLMYPIVHKLLGPRDREPRNEPQTLMVIIDHLNDVYEEQHGCKPLRFETLLKDKKFKPAWRKRKK